MRLSAEAEHWAARYRLTSRTRRNAFSNLPGGTTANRTELWMALRRALLRSAATGQLAGSAHAGGSGGTGGGGVRDPRWRFRLLLYVFYNKQKNVCAFLRISFVCTFRCVFLGLSLL